MLPKRYLNGSSAGCYGASPSQWAFYKSRKYIRVRKSESKSDVIFRMFSGLKEAKSEYSIYIIYVELYIWSQNTYARRLVVDSSELTT